MLVSKTQARETYVMENMMPESNMSIIHLRNLWYVSLLISHDFRKWLIVIFYSDFLFCWQIKEMYEKTHAAIREDPERKPSDKEPFKGKRYVVFHLY